MRADPTVALQLIQVLSMATTISMYIPMDAKMNLSSEGNCLISLVLPDSREI